TLYFRPAKYWHDQNVTLDIGAPVASIDRGNCCVVLEDGRKVAYDTLVLATGTRARDLPVPGVGLAGVFSLRRIDDVRALRGPLDAAKSVVIVGGGYIGLEVAAVARAEGRQVTVLEAEERVMKRVTSPVISDFMQGFHHGRGVDIRLQARLAAIEGQGRVTQ